MGGSNSTGSVNYTRLKTVTAGLGVGGDPFKNIEKLCRDFRNEAPASLFISSFYKFFFGRGRVI